MASDDTHKVNFLVPQELFDRFLTASTREYKSITGILTEWMASYVREAEQEQKAAQTHNLVAVLTRISGILFQLSKTSTMDDQTKATIATVSDLVLTISKDPSICGKPEVATKLMEIERAAR